MMKDYIIEQSRFHPMTKSQDIVKQCYQAAFGAEHFIESIEKAEAIFQHEYEKVEMLLQKPLCEQISEKICRVNLSKWKALGMSQKELFELFVMTASEKMDGEQKLLDFLKVADALVKGREVSVSVDEWNLFYEKYKEAGLPAIHHSKEYCLAEKPSYRLVRSSLLVERGYLGYLE